MSSFRTATSCVIAVVATASLLGQQPSHEEPPPPLPIFPAEQAWLVNLGTPAAGGAMDEARVYVPLQTGITVALDRHTGATVWTRDTETAWPPVVGAGVVYLAEEDQLQAVVPSTGLLRWSAPLTQPLVAPIALAGGWLVGVMAPDIAVAFNPADGAVVWQRPLGSGTRHPAAAQDGRLYFTLEDSRVLALNALDGTPVWERALEGALSAPAVSSDRVFIGSDTNDFHALDGRRGGVKWKWRSGGDVIGADASMEGQVFFASLDNLLRSVNTGNGNQRWRKEIPSRPATAPRAIGDIVIVSGVSPTIYAYDAETGTMFDSYTAPAELQGPPLLDPMLVPFRVAVVLVTRTGPIVGLYPTAMLYREPTLAPLRSLPGVPLPREPTP